MSEEPHGLSHSSAWPACCRAMLPSYLNGVTNAIYLAGLWELRCAELRRSRVNEKCSLAFRCRSRAAFIPNRDSPCQAILLPHYTNLPLSMHCKQPGAKLQNRHVFSTLIISSVRQKSAQQFVP